MASMIGWVIVSIILILLAFGLGRRQGKRAASHSPQQLDALGEAWQRGYDEAVRYLGQSGGKAPAEPAVDEALGAPGGPVPPDNAQPAQPQPAAVNDAAPVVSGAEAVRGSQPYLQRVPANAASAYRAPAPAAATGSAVPAKPMKALTKRERELRNINITLYVAALMIVAAGALFLSFALPPLSKLIALFLLSAAFYGGGLITYSVKPSLRPAGAAFAGTGLALLPLCAIATHSTLELSGPATWLIFSAIGTVAVGYATLTLKSRVLAWVAVLILVSTAMAGAATMQRGVLYYMLILLVLSIVLMLLAARSERIRASIFFQALIATAQLLPAFVFVLAAILVEMLTSRDLFWIFAFLTAQLLISVRLLANRRLLRTYAARASFMAMLVSGCNYLGLTATSTWLVLACALGLQAVAVLRWATGYRQRFGLALKHLQIERAVLWSAGIASVFFAYFAAEGFEAFMLSCIAVPVFMALAVPGLLRGTKLEIGAIAVLPLVTLVDLQNYSWRPLPAFVLALVGLSLAHRRTRSLLKEITGHVRWVLELIGAGVLGAALQELTTDGDGSANGTASLIAVLLVMFILWVANLASRSLLERGLAQAHRLGRVGASALLGVVLLLGLRILSTRGEDGYGASSMAFLGLSSLAWFIVGLVVAAGLVIASGWRLRDLAVQRPELGQSISLGAAGLLLGLYALSFGRHFWPLAIFIGAASLGYFIWCLRRSINQRWKVIYAALAQVLFSSMVWWLAYSMEFDIHARFCLLLVSVAIPQLVRLLASIRRGNALRSELRWMAVGLLAGIPAATLAYRQFAGGLDRGAVLLACLFFGLHGLAAFKAETGLAIVKRQLYLLAPILSLTLLISIPALAMPDATGWVRTIWWSSQAACAMLLAVGLGALILEWRLSAKKQYSLAVALAIFLPAVWAAAWQAGSWWAVAAHLLMACALILMVHTRSSAWYAAGSSIMLAVAILRAVFEVRQAGGALMMELMDAAWALAGTGMVLYLLAIFHGRMKEPTPGYPRFGCLHADPPGAASRLYFAGMLFALLLAGGIGHLDAGATWQVVGGALLIFGVAVLVRLYELPQALVIFGVDGFILLGALLSLSSYAQIAGAPRASSVAAYACIVAAVLVVWRNVRADARLQKIYLLAASAAGSLALLTALVESNGAAQVIGLVFFGALVAWGLKLGERLFIWWGAAAITLAVLWFLRDLAFLWLVVIGLGLIAAAVFKLVKVDKQESVPAKQGSLADPPMPAEPERTGQDGPEPS
ncbi:hypothetical protein [Glutamicibacter sp. 0426]|uniref:hypothetical protein n=1 Tax=Glutamicibacter sp. 0426 TaxID=1913445 RepID=UPI00093FD367|nr:hypothetical protein [Glutamicibacter sp. 0426]